METLLEPGQTEETSDPYEIAAGDSVTIGLFATGSDDVPAGAVINVFAVTPGNPTLIGTLGGHALETKVKQISGPCSIQVYRADISRYSKDVGVYVDDGA